MPRPKSSVPSYSHHRASGQAFVKLPDGAGGYRFVYLGRHGSAESKEAYRRELAELDLRQNAEAAVLLDDPTVTQIFAAFLKYAERHYRPTHRKTSSELSEYKAVSRITRELYGRVPAREFGPLALKAVRSAMIARSWARGFINQRVGRIKRVWKWAASEQLVPITTYQALATVAGLQRGRTDAREAEPIGPVDEAAVDATLPHLDRYVRGLVEFQRLTGCRPGEAVLIRRADIDTGGSVWLYRPATHKTAWRGKPRIIAIGPKAQEVLREFLTPAIDDYLFSPRRAREERLAAKRAARKSKVQPSQICRRVDAPKRSPGARYKTGSYAYAIARACDRVFPPPARLARREGESVKVWKARLSDREKAELKEWRRAHRWHPNQLRHSYATRVRKEHGLEAAQVLLGHARADVTQLYAERNLDLALTVAAKIG